MKSHCRRSSEVEFTWAVAGDGVAVLPRGSGAALRRWRDGTALDPAFRAGLTGRLE